MHEEPGVFPRSLEGRGGTLELPVAGSTGWVFIAKLGPAWAVTPSLWFQHIGKPGFIRGTVGGPDFQAIWPAQLN